MTREQIMARALIEAGEIAVPPGGEMVAIKEIQAIVEKALIEVGIVRQNALTLQPSD